MVIFLSSGRDSHPRRGGGTWLGISKSGRIASLTNVRISDADINHSAIPRGWFDSYITMICVLAICIEVGDKTIAIEYIALQIPNYCFVHVTTLNTLFCPIGQRRRKAVKLGGAN